VASGAFLGMDFNPVWLPVVDTFRTLVFQPGSFERIDGMIV
jgi:hypothetical protein